MAARIPDRSEALTLLIKGEFPVEINYLSGAIEFAKKGVPVGWNLLTPTITRVYPMAIANSAPHPNAAKLVYDFLLSVPGQRIFSRFGMIPSNFKAAPTKDLSILKEQDYKSINVRDQNLIKIGTRIWEESLKQK